MRKGGRDRMQERERQGRTKNQNLIKHNEQKYSVQK